jgi:hypothetical protein
LGSYLRLDGTDTQTALVRRGARGPRHRAAVECGYVKESAAGAKKNGAGEPARLLLHAARSGSESTIISFLTWDTNKFFYFILDLICTLSGNQS